MEITGKLGHFTDSGIDYIVEEVKPGQIWVHMMSYYDEVDDVAAVLPKIENETMLELVLRFSGDYDMAQMPQSMIALRDSVLHGDGSNTRH
ncbi:hypothetical protein [Ruegeria arenilitoris]|uniref:hypothetical protein n=1 Tax=Ruegeria arenilitoris TaxID=1173585 RepID=UPI00147A56AF|nr:hypothetical protein [Ruegeria arenilitoris]